VFNDPNVSKVIERRLLPKHSSLSSWYRGFTYLGTLVQCQDLKKKGVFTAIKTLKIKNKIKYGSNAVQLVAVNMFTVFGRSCDLCRT